MLLEDTGDPSEKHLTATEDGSYLNRQHIPTTTACQSLAYDRTLFNPAMATPCTSCNHNRTVHIRWFAGAPVCVVDRRASIHKHVHSALRGYYFFILDCHPQKIQWIDTNKYFELLEHVGVIMSIHA
jgi:hypothetical protein